MLFLKKVSETVDSCALDEKGFWDLERDEQSTFRWTKAQFSIAVPDVGSFYVTLLVASELPDNTLRVFGPAGKHYEIPLLIGWQRIDVATMGATRLDFEVALTFVPGPRDLRVLGIMVRDFLFHADSDRHRKIAERHLNA